MQTIIRKFVAERPLLPRKRPCSIMRAEASNEEHRKGTLSAQVFCAGCRNVNHTATHLAALGIQPAERRLVQRAAGSDRDRNYRGVNHPIRAAIGIGATGMQLWSSGFFRIIRDVETDTPLPVLMMLGGHRTGSDAVELFGDVGHRSIVGVDYPYDGPDKVKGVIPIARAIPLARQAFLDTVPAVSLLLDWLVEQAWVDKKRIILVGASLGVPFAATAAGQSELLFEAARDPKRLRYTDGQHVQSNRKEIIAELQRIADEELIFITQ